MRRRRSLGVIGFLLFGLYVDFLQGSGSGFRGSCEDRQEDLSERELKQVTGEKVRNVKQELADDYLDKSYIHGIGIGSDGEREIIFVSVEPGEGDRACATLSETRDGVPIVIEEREPGELVKRQNQFQ